MEQTKVIPSFKAKISKSGNSYRIIVPMFLIKAQLLKENQEVTVQLQ